MKRFAAVILAIALVTACKSTPTEPDSSEVESTTASEQMETAESAATAEPGALDGMTFTVTTMGPGGEEEPDTLIFADGTFESTQCREWGFSPAKYKTYPDEGSIYFQATATSDDEGTLKWQGSVEGDEISGGYKWMKKGQDTATYAFEGTKSGG